MEYTTNVVGVTEEEIERINGALPDFNGFETPETSRYSDRQLLILLLNEVRGVNERIEGIENDARNLVSPENMARVAQQFLGDPDALMKMIG